MTVSCTVPSDCAARPPHVALLATPGMGHLIPMAELAKRLVSRHDVTAKIFTFASTAAPTQRAFLVSLPPDIASRSLPPVDLSDLPRGTDIVALMTEECARSVPATTEMLSSLGKTTRLVAFITDMFGVDLFDAARDAGVELSYMFMPVNLHTVSLFLHLPELVATIPGEFRDLAAARLRAHSWAGHRRTAPRKVQPSFPRSYPIGPLILTSSSNGATPRAACLEWLDRQPDRSVIFVSVGSGGSLSTEELRELALGLERSGQRFLWVVRILLQCEGKRDPLSYLPEGFVQRTKDLGFLVPSWAPQTEVLAHKATGGFLTHCGWNSTLESLVHGVPMVAWPLFAEQRQNALMLAEGVGATIRVPEQKDMEAIAEVVRELMEGEGKDAQVRNKVAELQKAAKESLREGGVSTTALDEWVREFAAHKNK